MKRGRKEMREEAGFWGWKEGCIEEVATWPSEWHSFPLDVAVRDVVVRDGNLDRNSRRNECEEGRTTRT